MKKLLPVCVALLVTLGIYSCNNSGANTPEIIIDGTWQLKQEFSNEGEHTPLKEFPLSDCDKQTTLEIFPCGKFIEKSYYDDLGTGGECIMDTEETKGKWKNETDNTFIFTYNNSNALLIRKSQVTIQNKDLVIVSVYNDPDLGPKTTLKFIYTKSK